MSSYILTNGVIITMNKKRDILEGYSVAISDGIITSIGKTEDIIRKNPYAQIIDCSNQCILPGFIDCGGYAGYQITKGFISESIDAGDEAMNTIFHDPNFWLTDGMLFGAERLRAGVTTGTVLYDHKDSCDSSTYYGNIRSHISGYTTTGARVVSGIDFKDKESTQQLKGILSHYSEDPLVLPRVYLGNIISSIAEKKRIPPERFTTLTGNDIWRLDTASSISSEYGIGVIANAYGNNLNILYDSKSPILKSNLLLRYCNDFTYREVMIASETGICAAHAPEATIRYCQFSEMMEAGVIVAIMSDCYMNGEGPDMLQAARRAQMIEQIRFDDIFYLPVGKQLEAITIDAAKALNIDHITGSLETGKLADIITVDMSAARTIPWQNMPIHRLMMDSNCGEISNVFVAGNPVIKNRKLLCIDEHKLLKDATAMALYIASELKIDNVFNKASWGQPYKYWQPQTGK